MDFENIKQIKQRAFDDVQADVVGKQNDFGIDGLKHMLYLQFWLMYYINEWGNIEVSKLKRIAGEFEKTYVAVDVNLRREKKLKETFCKMSRGEDVDLTTDDCADFTEKDWETFGKGLNKYFSCAADAVKNGKA